MIKIVDTEPQSELSAEPVDLLVLGYSMNAANAYSDSLRNAGIAVHLTSVTGLDTLEGALETCQPQIALINQSKHKLDFSAAVARIKEVNPDASIILLSGKTDNDFTHAMDIGVQDIVGDEDSEHLIFVVSREIHTLRLRKELGKTQKKIIETEQRSTVLAENTQEAIAYIHEGMHVYANPAYASMFGFVDTQDIEGLPIMDLIAADDRSGFKKTLRSISENQEPVSTELSCITDSGKKFKASMELSWTTVENEPCVQIIVRDKSSGEALEARISELASKDLQTSLYNRHYFMNKLESTVAELDNNELPITLIQLNISNLSSIKDKCGIECSDNILREIAHVLSDNTYPTDLVARFGEHEFSILCTRGTDANTLANRLLNSLTDHLFESADQLVSATYQIGIASSDSPRVTSAYDFLGRVGAAVRLAAEQGGSAIAHYAAAESPAEPESTDNKIVGLIDHALEHDRFRLVFQPMVSLQGDSRENYAVFVRLITDEGHDLDRDEFLSQAGDTGRLAEIDRWVIRNAIKELVQQRKAGNQVNLSVIISEAGIKDDSLLLWICDCLREFRAKGSWLTLQFNQQDVISNLQLVRKLAEGLKKIHCRVAIDNFTGEEESMKLLQHLPIDIVKFAPTFMQDISNKPDVATNLTYLNSEIQSMDMQTVAMGVEESSNLATLWNVGVNYIQGNFVQEPTETIEQEAGEH